MTAAITDYATLSAAINDFEERDFDSGEIDRIIGLTESMIRLELPPAFSNEASAALTFVAGSVAQPSGFIRALAMTHATYGAMTEKDIGTIRTRRIGAGSGTPAAFAIFGSTIELDTTYAGAMTLDYEGSLAGLSGSNTTNWLISRAPHVYLAGCLAVAKFYESDYGDFAGIQTMVSKTLDELGFQSIVGQTSRASVTIPGPTP